MTHCPTSLSLRTHRRRLLAGQRTTTVGNGWPPAATPNAGQAGRSLRNHGPSAGNSAIGYDELDRRLMDTFPASDAVAQY